MNEIIIKKIKLKNFRSHENYNLDCNKKTTLILGKNGSGKTSVLEAIYIALNGKSFKATDKDIIKRGADFYRIEVYYKNGEKITITYDGHTQKKLFQMKDKKSARLPKNQKYPVVLFLPEDLHIIGTSPTKKRDYFDRILTQLDDKYNSFLLRYNRALRQRNELLKQELITQNDLFSWDVMLAKYGVEIQKKREKLIELINVSLNKTYHSIIDNNDVVELRYKSHDENIDESEYLKILMENAEKDIITGHTNFGVHRDDYDFIFNGGEADKGASRGESRSIILALKFIEANIIYDYLKKKPLVLLDDVFSELDDLRQKSLVENFKDHQVILTSVK